MIIRRAREADLEVLGGFIRDLAHYERALEHAQATPEQLHQSFFGPSPQVYCDLIESDEGVAAGFAVWFLNYSTWTGTHGIYLEDLFVRPEHRKQRIGLALMQALAREAKERGCGRFLWQVLDWNEPALRFYESLGATVLREWLTVRVDGEALDRLAAG